MDQHYTHISVILDRTGSMESIRDDVIGGFNTFLHDQQKQDGKATLTLVQFDTQDSYEVVHHFRPIAEIPDLDRKTYVPRASTPLYDAMGRGINDLEAYLVKLLDGDRPQQIMVVVITDGMENSSREFTREKVKQMIKDRQEKDGWQFVFLSADFAAMEDSLAMGIDQASNLLFAKSKAGSTQAFNSLSKQTSEYRSGRKRKFSFDADDEQSDLLDKK